MLDKTMCNYMTGLDHPPYSPGLTPRDCWLFGLLRNEIKENVFRNAGEVEDFVCNFGAR
jgi:hypothetical protein